METPTTIVNELLEGKNNYEKWCLQLQSYLEGHGIWDIVADSDVEDGEEAKDELSSEQKNSLARHAILISCATEPFLVIKSMISARKAWAALQAKYYRKPTAESEDKQTESMPYWKMFQAVKCGDWDETQAILEKNPEAIEATIKYSGKNALHVAVSEGHLHIVEKLVLRMTNEQMERRRVDELTPLAAAIEIGSLPIAMCLVRRHAKLAALTHPEGLPVRYAMVTSRREMVPFLYSETPIKALMNVKGGIHCAALLSQAIYSKHYDVALSLLRRHPELVITEDDPGKSPLWALATSKLFSDNASTMTFWRRWIYERIQLPSEVKNHVSVKIENLEDNQSDRDAISVDKAVDSFCLGGRKRSGMLGRLVSVLLRPLDIKSIYELKVAGEQTREILEHVCKEIKGMSDRRRLQKAGISNAMVQAAYHGNLEFITRIREANPELVWGPFVSRKVIETAIKLRQPEIFSLVYGLRDKVAMANYCDDNKSNLVHKAAIIADPMVLSRIPGAALQMQSELKWFKEVEAIGSQESTPVTTADHPGSTAEKHVFLTARQIFTESHRDLVIAGEQWMKGTSSSCTVVGALIITVTFAAAFTFPGGNDQNHGYPMFSNKLLFRIFMISNSVALSASTSSVLIFLGILTSRYAEDDFLASLPKKLIAGLSTLFFSIVAMLLAFCVGIALMFHHALWIVVPSAILAGIPIALFAGIQIPLLYEILMSTYGPSKFKKSQHSMIG